MDGQYAVLRIGAQGNEGDIIVHDDANREVFHFNLNEISRFAAKVKRINLRVNLSLLPESRL